MPYAEKRKFTRHWMPLLDIRAASQRPASGEKRILGRLTGISAVTLFEELRGMIAARERGFP
jgi:hypothetical protein